MPKQTLGDYDGHAERNNGNEFPHGTKDPYEPPHELPEEGLDPRDMEADDFHGMDMPCPKCGCVVRKCVKVNPPNMRHADPTETYTLECGHVVM